MAERKLKMTVDTRSTYGMSPVGDSYRLVSKVRLYISIRMRNRW